MVNSVTKMAILVNKNIVPYASPSDDIKFKIEYKDHDSTYLNGFTI